MIKFSVVQSQIALFLTTLDTRKMLNVAVAIQETSDDLLDADPLVLPIPADAPPEFPRLRLNSRDGHWIFQVAGTRLDFFYERSSGQQGMEEFKDIVDKQAQIYNNIWQMLQKKYNASGSEINIERVQSIYVQSLGEVYNIFVFLKQDHYDDELMDHLLDQEGEILDLYQDALFHFHYLPLFEDSRPSQSIPKNAVLIFSR
jgi:hypothetical protein